jgi:PPM family protein phosphatase
MEYFAKSDIGNIREKNEDFYYTSDNLFIVADGMGGHNAGEVASKTAVDAFVSYFKKNIDSLNSGPKQEYLKDERIKTVLSDSIRYANNCVLGLSFKNKLYKGMGTTLTGCYIQQENKTCCSANIIHAGDSRLYLKSGRNFSLITEDHTIVGKMYRDGLITYEESFSHPLKNYLENVLGMEDDFKCDYTSVTLHRNDIILLCSDGLNSMLKDTNINSTIAKYKSCEKITDALIQEAKANGGNDNITVITIKI